MIIKNININSPLVSINKPEIAEKIKIFLKEFFCIIENKNLRKSSEKTI